MSEPTKEQIEKGHALMEKLKDFGPLFCGDRIADALAAETAPLHEKIASLEKQLAEARSKECEHGIRLLSHCSVCAALAPSAQTQRHDLVRLAHLYEHPDCEIPGCTCCPSLIDLLGKVAAQTQQGLSEEGIRFTIFPGLGNNWMWRAWVRGDWIAEGGGGSGPADAMVKACEWGAANVARFPFEIAPLNLEKQPSPAAAPAQLSALGLLNEARAYLVHTGGLHRDHDALCDRIDAALAGQPAPTATPNQCDGCRAGRPIDKNGNHRMGDGDYHNLQACQRHLYSAQPVLTDDQKALRAAALEEAANQISWAVDLLDMYDRFIVSLGQPSEKVYSATHVAGKKRAREVLASIRALAGSPAQRAHNSISDSAIEKPEQGRLGKKGGV